MKILITGGASLLGRYLTERPPKNYEIESTWFSSYIFGCKYRMDITNAPQVRHVFEKIKPDVIIHCAAQGSVDYCERNYQDAHRTNVEGTENILKAARDYNAKVVFLSTNAVFSGTDPLYAENDKREPINRYGAIKKLAEDVVSDYPNHLIIRPFLMYGWPYSGSRRNWMDIIVTKLTAGEKCKLVNDVFCQPTYAGYVAEVIWKLLEYENQTFNMATEQVITFYEFGLMIADVFELDKSLIEKVSIRDFESLTRRPINSCYDVSKIKQLGIELPLREGLERALSVTKST